MKTILIEGIPEEGETRLSEAVCEWLQDRGEDVRLLSERAREEEPFPDYWRRLDVKPQRMAKEFLRRWRRIYRARTRDDAAYVFDNALLNQVQYLMALDMEEEGIADFYRTVCVELLPLGPIVIFLEGDAEAIARRVMAELAEAWTSRVVDRMATIPYQRARGRSGEDGLTSFMIDSMQLCRRLIDEGLLPVVRCDVTSTDRPAHTRIVLEGLEARWPNA
jgi:hypothetical protein